MGKVDHQEAIDLLNEIARDLGVSGGRRKHSMNLWTPPHDWKGREKYCFGYTPWKTRDAETGKTGFFALKYRVFKNGRMQLVKSVRFGRRKKAKQRALEWYNKYYHGEKK